MAALSEHFLTLCERIELFELDPLADDHTGDGSVGCVWSRGDACISRNLR